MSSESLQKHLPHSSQLDETELGDPAKEKKLQFVSLVSPAGIHNVAVSFYQFRPILFTTA